MTREQLLQLLQELRHATEEAKRLEMEAEVWRQRAYKAYTEILTGTDL